MVNRKLLEIIGLWGKEAQKEFQIFLASPYFNKGVQATVLLQFYNLVLKYGANPEHPKLGKEAVVKHLFGGARAEKKEFSRLDKLGSGLLALAEQYLAQKEYESRQSDARKLLALMKFYRIHHKDHRAWQAKEAAFKALEAAPWRDAWHYFDAFELHGEVANMGLPYSTLKKDLGLDLADQALDKFFVAAKLEIEVTKLMQSHLSNAKHQPTRLTDAARNWIPAPGEEIPALIELQNDLIKMFERLPGAAEAIAFENKITVFRHLFPYELTRYLYTCCRGVITLLWGQFQDDLNIRQAAFQLFKRHLEEGYLLFDGKINTNSLRTLLAFSLSADETAWAKKLLEDFPPESLFGTKHSTEFCQLNWAYYYFFLKDYDNAEKHLRFSSFENQLFGLMAEIQLIKIYYETGNELLEARMKALDQKIRRTSHTEAWKLQFSNFLKMLEKLLRAHQTNENAARLGLLNELSTSTAVYSKEWLLEKLSVKL